MTCLFDVMQLLAHDGMTAEPVSLDTLLAVRERIVHEVHQGLDSKERQAHPFRGARVTTGGTFRFQDRLVYLANAMVDQHIRLEETDNGIWAPERGRAGSRITPVKQLQPRHINASGASSQ